MRSVGGARPTFPRAFRTHFRTPTTTASTAMELTMTDGPAPPAPDPTVQSARRRALDEDWAATIVGLLLLALVLLGAIPGWLVP